MLDVAKIPGMIEPVEQMLLRELAGSEIVGDDRVIVEFGCFLGLSTACLVNGAVSHGAREGKSPLIYAYDSFACMEQGGFAKHLWAFARKTGVEKLIRQDGGRLDFAPVYHHHVGAAEAAGLLKTTQGELRDASYDGPPIGLMHIDLPKFYDELKFILVRFFPHLTPGAAVVFQDYLYQWSASLIAAVQLLAEAGIVRFEQSRATALVTRVIRPPTPEDLLALDLQMSSTPVEVLIDRALELLKTIELDRPETFVPRVHLAKVQHLWERGNHPAAQRAFVSMINEMGGLSRPVFNVFKELMMYGFSIRKAYELDH